MIKLITTIQSFTDVITNSSSSVFIMHEDYAHYYNNLNDTNECISICLIDIEWIKQNYWNWKLILQAVDADFNEVSTQEQVVYGGRIYSHYWKTPSEDAWETWVENNKDLLESELSDKYFVEIEDHFENAYEVTERAYDDAIVSESRH